MLTLLARLTLSSILSYLPKVRIVYTPLSICKHNFNEHRHQIASNANTQGGKKYHQCDGLGDRHAVDLHATISLSSSYSSRSMPSSVGLHQCMLTFKFGRRDHWTFIFVGIVQVKWQILCHNHHWSGIEFNVSCTFKLYKNETVSNKISYFLSPWKLLNEANTKRVISLRAQSTDWHRLEFPLPGVQVFRTNEEFDEKNPLLLSKWTLMKILHGPVSSRSRNTIVEVVEVDERGERSKLSLDVEEMNWEPL